MDGCRVTSSVGLNEGVLNKLSSKISTKVDIMDGCEVTFKVGGLDKGL